MQTRYDNDLEISISDFINSDYESILKELTSYSSYWKELSKQAKTANEEGNKKKSKVLWLLSDICSFMVHAEYLHEVYSSYMIMQEVRSTAPEDLTIEDIAFLSEIIEECTDFRLKARIGDVLWLYSQKKNIKHLEIALENFIKFPLNVDSLFTQDSKDSFMRAIKLSLSTKKPTQELEKILLNAFHNGKYEDGLYCIHINKLLVALKLDISVNLDVLQKLESFAKKFDKEKQYYIARDYYHSIKGWYEKLNNIDEIHKTIVNIAENFVLEATNRKDSQMTAAMFFENAIQEYRGIARKYRAEYSVDERLSEIYTMMGSSNKLATDEMSLITTDPIDISPLIISAIERIEQKEFEEAFVIFTSISSTSNFEALRKSSEKSLGSSLSRLFGTTYYSGDGRVIAKTGGGLSTSGDDYELQLEAQMQHEFSIDIDLSVKGSIYPAFEQLVSEHTVTKEYIMSVCLNSSIVPRNRASIWAEGLYYGFEKNFLISTHLLIPQIEHLIRLLLKQAGTQTTVLEASGIEMEKGLSTIIEEPKLEELINKNLIMELKYLLTKSIGYNLRNDVAHGLSTSQTFQSVASVYVWWRILRLVVQNSPLIELIKELKNK